ncbi:MOSC domain containing protein [Ammonifex degensii KC4]|uniref:MOSC domain containing protein n=1 Tax=Ammonifex degensii (strain DSM 10501 / KC4) TaxID=429009 RepID=C9RBF2_AMMDK|nr:MOSC domain-containing protein [Ammonifex degensii]ACX51579.1 MOSC domain containing protein [Ammonifex degensii KC4]
MRNTEGTRGRVVAVCLSKNKGERKENVGKGKLVAGHGLEGDAHAGDWHRQVSLLALESIEKMRARGLEVGPGDFAENITTQGLDFTRLSVGTLLRIGTALGEVTQIGKECHTACAIRRQVGDCIMPREGVFVRIIKSGTVEVGDIVEVVNPTAETGGL